MIKRLLIILSTTMCFWPGINNATERVQTQRTMRQIFDLIRVVLPVSVDDTRFADPALEPEIRQSLRLLAKQTAVLSDHVADPDIGFRYLGQLLTRHATDAYRYYDAHRYQSAQGKIQLMTSVCVACHSRLPSQANAAFAEDFVSQNQLAKLPLNQRGKLQVATRQFDDAIRTYEQLFTDRSIHPAQLIGGPLTDYLILCIRVKGDLSRPIPSLKAFAKRPKVWRSMQVDIAYWIGVLEALQLETDRPATVEKGRELINAALSPDTYPMDRRPLVQYIVASSILNRFIADQRAKHSRTAELAEAYYLLGLTEYRIDRDYRLSQAEHYLETSIQLAPGRPFARRAYALLEEETILGYSGSSGTNVPDDVQHHLDGLRHLIDRQSESPAK